MSHRVVVTGLGLVTPVGTDVESTWNALLAGTPGAAPITKFDPQKLSVRFACEVKGFDPLKYIDRKEARRYDLFAQFALAAAHQAVTQAGLEGKFPSPDRTGTPHRRDHVGRTHRSAARDRTRRRAGLRGGTAGDPAAGSVDRR